MNTILDLQLSSELQELYLENKEWISHLSFLKDEYRFFAALFDARQSTLKKHTPEQTLIISNNLALLQQKISQLDTLTIKHQHLIESVLKDKDHYIGLELIEQNAAISIEIKSLLLADRKIKNELFALIGENEMVTRKQHSAKAN